MMEIMKKVLPISQDSFSFLRMCMCVGRLRFKIIVSGLYELKKVIVTQKKDEIRSKLQCL